MTDPVNLTAALVKCPSITPSEAGCFDVLEPLLTDAGFECHRINRGGISNLFARWGHKGSNKTFGFNGHIDVVPVGDVDQWTYPPFAAEVHDGYLYGRGSTDMKSGVAAFVAGAVDFVTTTPPDGAVVLTITGDEEADAVDGTTAILDWMAEQGETMQMCLVGEPTGVETFGDTIKIGRRGSMNCHLTVIGTQGHSAYPHRSNNPIPALVRLLDDLASHPLDDGTEHFDPSTLVIVTVDTGNPATNVIPARTNATINIRFNDSHSGESLSAWLRQKANAIAVEFGVEIETRFKVSGESFITPPGELSALVCKAVEDSTGQPPELSTSGGTSDARFVTQHCPVVEFGLVGKRMHAVDERVYVDDIRKLKEAYMKILTSYFAGETV